MKTLCVVPVFNEDNRLNNLIDQIKSNEYRKYDLTYIFVNNGSTDKSLKIIKDSNIKYLNLKSNKGVGYALMIGYLYAKKYNFKYLIHLAGNGKMKPSQIELFMHHLLKENYDFVSGSRFLNGSSKKNNPMVRIILIKIFSFFLKIFFNKNISDPSCGFRAFNINIFSNFKKEYFEKKELFTYGYEYYSFGKVVNSKIINFKEIPVSMDYPSYGKYSKIKPISDWYVIAKFWIKGILSSNEL